MQILFLGTGPTEAIPREGHTDALCRDARAGGKSRRRRSCALVTSGRTTILIDSGPDIFEQLSRHKPKRIDAVLLTHGHEDAVGGLRDLDEWLSITPRLRHPSLKIREGLGERYVPIFTDHLTAERLTTRFGRFGHLKFSRLKDYAGFKAGQLEILPFPVLHTHDVRYKTYGYKFDSFCYASDFYELPKRTKNLLKELDTVILDGAMYMGVKMPTHMSADATVRLAGELQAKRLVITQSGHTYPPHLQAEKSIKKYAAAHAFEYPKQITLAYDGLRLKM
ncbi:MAG: MBL fold metallo-hydrolase [Patescibacteria group bacterium]|nr:MBL fold metallo-hydrolase [Patescibacteria group bacterium]